MEIQDLFRNNWKALVLIPSITALAAGLLFVSSSSETYEAAAVVSLREFVPTDSPAAIRALIDDLDSALDSRQVAETVAEVAPAAESYRIESLAVGEGGDVRVAFVAPSAVLAQQALDAGVREALTIVSESAGRQAARRLVAAESVAEETSADLQDIEREAGAADLSEEIARRSADLLSLRNQIAAAEGSVPVQNALTETLQEKQAELAVIEEQLLAWTNLRARFDGAVASGAAAALEVRQIDTNEADLQSADLLQSPRTAEVSNLQALVRVVLAATIVTAAVVAVLALALGSGRRRSTDEPAASDEQTAVGESAQPVSVVLSNPSDCRDH